MNGDKWYYVNPPSKTMVKPMARQRVSIGTFVLVSLNRLLDLAIAAFLVIVAYVLVNRWDIVYDVLTYGIR